MAQHKRVEPVVRVSSLTPEVDMTRQFEGALAAVRRPIAETTRHFMSKCNRPAPSARCVPEQLVSKRQRTRQHDRVTARWREVFGDPVAATAILDRLLDHSHMLADTR